MKKVTVIYHKDDDFTDLTIRINGKKFSEDKTEYISNLPIENWFQPSNDPYFEWSGLVQEIERATNSTMNEIKFEFYGADCDKTYFLDTIQQICSYKHTEDKNSNIQKNNNELQVESILNQARLDYDAQRYTAAFRGFESIATESAEAKFYLAEMYLFGDHVEMDDEKAFDLYTECYNSNFQTATYRLAQCYYYGWGCESDYEKSQLFAEKAFKLDDHYSNIAHYIYGCCAFYNDTIDEAIQHLKISTDAEDKGYYELGLAYKQIKKFTEAFKTFKRGINHESKCCAQLAICYAEGCGTKQDNYRAFQMMEKGSDDDIRAKMGLAGYYIQGIGTAQNLEKGAEILSELNEELPEDEDIAYLNGLFFLATEQHEEAISFFQKAIKEGNYEAKISLGDCYIKLNQFQSAEEVLLSALNDFPNNTDVYKSLGDLYFDVDSPLKNNRKALKNYEKAVSLGSTDAMYALFSYYVEIKDEEKAIDFLSRATKGGHIEATLLSGILAYEANDFEEAIRLLTVCAELGMSHAQYYLGRCYWVNDTKFTDRNEGISWLIQAANNGSGEACFNLSVIYEADDVFKDPQKAFEYELKGHELGDVDCSYWLARDYLLNENYINTTEGIEIFRQLGKQGIAKAKYFLAQYYYEKYKNIVRKIGIFDTEEESALMTLSKCVPYVNFVTTPFSWLKKNIRQISKEKDLTENDYSNIAEMIKLFTQLKDNPCDLKDDQIKSVKKRLRSIKDKYLRR